MFRHAHDLDHQIGADIARSDDRAGNLFHYACSFAKAARTEPRPEMRASTTSPHFTPTIGPRAPDITVSPALSGRPTRAMVFASHRTAESGSPRQAAPAPAETCSSALSITMPAERRSRFSSFFGVAPST